LKLTQLKPGVSASLDSSLSVHGTVLPCNVNLNSDFRKPVLHFKLYISCLHTKKDSGGTTIDLSDYMQMARNKAFHEHPTRKGIMGNGRQGNGGQRATRE
jgi:hypothetical protein